jgi:hypothetical protein
MKVLAEAALRARSTDAATLMRYLTSEETRFDGHKGVPLSFRQRDRQLRQPVYVIRFPAAGEDPRAVQMIESPSGRRADEDVAAFLDRLGHRPGQPVCSSVP